jgi:hypothetical protein
MGKVLVFTALAVFMTAACGTEECQKEGDIRYLDCAEDASMDQPQYCYSGHWYDDGLCICSSENRFCHEYKGLKWSELSSNQDWAEASSYCKQIKGRLPTISELRTLIKDNPSTETGGDCEVTDECLSNTECHNDYCGDGNWDDESHSYFGDRRDLWSSSEEDINIGYAWYVNFDGGTVYLSQKILSMSFRCVGD